MLPPEFMKPKSTETLDHRQQISESVRLSVFENMVGKPEGKSPLGRTRRGWEDNIKMDLQEVGCGGNIKLILCVETGN